MKEKEFLPLLKEKLGIESLNPMQSKMLESGSSAKDIILLSPTGSGKTLAFTLPVLKMLKPSTGRVQCVIIAPSRELVQQIAGVLKKIALDYRVVELYGGHKVEDEVNSLKVTPDIIVATPGRLLDHSVRKNTELLPVRILVLDEFDKSLELGFEEEMKKLVSRMKNVSRFILTSATPARELPEFLNLENPLTINFLEDNKELKSRLAIHSVKTDNKDKLEGLLQLLHNIETLGIPEKSIIFSNHRESAERIYEYLKSKGVDCCLYHGALDQRERETAVAQFNNGSKPILVATDLAARGLDIEQVKAVVHYHQALTPEAFTHRNGRTARVDNEGDVYLLLGPDEALKEYVEPDNEIKIDPSVKNNLKSGFKTLYISGGKREKLSKGDIAGFLIKEGGASPDQVGKIDIFDHYSLVALPSSIAKNVIKQTEGKKIKGEKRKISILNN